MFLHQLPPIVHRRSKRVGRGRGSGKGKTSGRGMKGQKARSKVKLGFEGGQLKLIKRLPFLRGKGFKSHRPKPLGVDLARLNVFRAGSRVSPADLKEKGIVKKVPAAGIKLLAKGELKKKLHLRGFLFSRNARAQVEKLGGIIDE